MRVSMNSSAPNRQIIFYIAAVLLAAWLWMLSIKLGFRPSEWVWVTVLMWIPGLASILFRFVFREGFADVGWRVGRIRFFQKRNPAGARRSKMKIVSVAVSGVGVSVRN